MSQTKDFEMKTEVLSTQKFKIAPLDLAALRKSTKSQVVVSRFVHFDLGGIKKKTKKN